MGAFEYQAMDAAQKLKRGVVEADTPRQARGVLRQLGLVPLEVQAVELQQSKKQYWIGAKERTIVLQQLATLLKAGMTLEEVLQVLTEQADRPGTRRALGAIRSRVLEGHSLSQAMTQFPSLFPTLYSASVAAGERTGQLEAVLERLAAYASKRQSMRRGIGLALVYPIFLFVVALAVVGALIGFVVPRVITVFDAAGQTLPWITRSMLAVSDVLSRFGGLAVVLLAGFAVLGWLAYRKDAVRVRVDSVALRWPLVGRLVCAHQTALLMRTLSIMVSSAVPLVASLHVCASVLSNRVAKADIETVGRRVSEGVSLSKALAQVPWVSSIAKRLTHAGEKSGELGVMLEQAADIEERGLDSAQSLVLSVIQPLMILLVGLVVMYIVLAIMLPILNMSQLLGGA